MQRISAILFLCNVKPTEVGLYSSLTIYSVTELPLCVDKRPTIIESGELVNSDLVTYLIKRSLCANNGRSALTKTAPEEATID
jgi:hypothetical protein